MKENEGITLDADTEKNIDDAFNEWLKDEHSKEPVIDEEE